MKTFYFLLSLLVIPICVLCQAPQTITLKNNKTSADVIKPELQYIFPDFQDGRVFLKGQKKIDCQLNYNFLLDEILFIDENGNKMALAKPHEVIYVLIAKRMFIPGSKGYYEVIENEDISLVYKWSCHISEKGKEGALGIQTDAPSVYQMNQMSFDAREWKLEVDKEAIASVEVLPYLKVKSKFIPITGAKDFIKAFSGRTAEIKAYINQNPVDFKKEADLRRLTKYCNSLKG
jgi:hypothetical protein